MSAHSEALAKLAFSSTPEVAITAADIKLPDEGDADYFRRLAPRVNPLALGWKCIKRAPTTDACLQGLVDLTKTFNPAHASWWIDDRGFAHVLLFSVKRGATEGEFEVESDVLKRPNKKLLVAAFNIRSNAATHQSSARDRIREAGGVHQDPDGVWMPTAPSQLLVPEKAPDVVASATQSLTARTTTSVGQLGLPPAPRSVPTAKQAARNPPAPARLASACWTVVREQISTSAISFNKRVGRLFDAVEKQQKVPGLTKTKPLVRDSKQVLTKLNLVQPFQTANIPLSRFAMVLLCNLPTPKLTTNDQQFLARPDAEVLCRLWIPGSAESAESQIASESKNQGANQLASDLNSSTVADKPLPPQSSSQRKRSSDQSTEVHINSDEVPPSTTMADKLPKVTNKRTAKPAATTTVVASSSSSSSTASSTVSGNGFLEKLDVVLNPKSGENSFFYEAGRMVANRAIEKPESHAKLIEFSSDLLSGAGMFAPDSAQMKAAGEVRASDLRTTACDWKNRTNTAFVMFGATPVIAGIKGFMDGGMRECINNHIAEIQGETEKLKTENTKLKRQLEEQQEELEEARKKTPKESPLDADMAC